MISFMHLVFVAAIICAGLGIYRVVSSFAGWPFALAAFVAVVVFLF